MFILTQNYASKVSELSRIFLFYVRLKVTKCKQPLNDRRPGGHGSRHLRASYDKLVQIPKVFLFHQWMHYIFV